MFPISWITVGIGAVGAFALSFLLHTMDVNRIENNWRAKLAAQETQLISQCNDDKKRLKDANDLYQKQVGDIGLKLAKYELYASKCVALSPDTSKLPPSGAGYAGQNGLSVGWLRSFAAECNTYRAQRITVDTCCRQ